MHVGQHSSVSVHWVATISAVRDTIAPSVAAVASAVASTAVAAMTYTAIPSATVAAAVPSTTIAAMASAVTSAATVTAAATITSAASVTAAAAVDRSTKRPSRNGRQQNKSSNDLGRRKNVSTFNCSNPKVRGRDNARNYRGL